MDSLRTWAYGALLLFVCGQATAEYRFDVWTADSGLPQNSVRAIVQTHDGYLWVGTLDGLARFDGVRFTVFTKANSPGLSGNQVTSLYEDAEGDLWVCLQSGIARYRSGRFTALGAREGVPAGAIVIAGDERGRPLAYTETAAFRWAEGKFLPALSGAGTSFSAYPVAIFWGTVENGLHIFFRVKETVLGISNGLPSMRITGVTADQYGNIWVATEEGLVKVRDGKVARIFTQQDGFPHTTLRAAGLVYARACEDRKGNLWISGAGPWLGRLKDGVFTGYPSSNTLSSQPLPLPSVAADYVNTFFEDREGNLWIGTEGSGLIRAREQIVNVISTRQGLHAANIYPVYEDRAGAVWIGSWWRGPARINSGVVTNFDLEQDTTAFCEDRTGRLWMGRINGVALFQNEKFSTAGVPAELTNHQTVTAICEDRHGVLWFGAENGLFSYKNGQVSSFTQQDGLTGGRISVIIEDRAGALWIGGRGGLTRLTEGRFVTWTEQDGLPGNRVAALYEDDAGALWIGTGDSGLGRFKDGRFTRYTTSEGMFDNGVFQILEDATGNFWMSSNRGIYRVSKRELDEFAEGRRRSITSVAYGKSDGMLRAECNGGHWPAGIKTRDGKLWFPTQEGVAVIDPAALRSNTNPPPVVIESFVVDRVPQPMDLALRVPRRKANIEIQYTGLSFVNSERISFKYRLTPADEDWVEAGRRRAAYYSHLAPGHYTFSVLAANSDGVWSPTGASLAFIVLPAWYQTAWFRGLAIVAVGGAGVVAYRRRISRLEAQRAAQQEFSRRLIESQDAERKRIAAELHDSLGQELLLIKNRALLGLKPPHDVSVSAGQAPAAGQIQNKLDHFEEISRVTSRALQEVRDIAYNLRPYQLDQFGLTEGIEAVVRKLASASGVRFTVEVDSIDNVFSPADESHLFRVIQEATNNIVKHSGASQARVQVRREERRLRVLIEDNGRGFRSVPDGDVKSSARRASDGQKGGFGLPGMAERARILGGMLQVKSAPGQGTQLDLTLPIPTDGQKDPGAAGG